MKIAVKNITIALALILFSMAAGGLGQALGAPILKTIKPLGAQRGTKFTLTLIGQDLTPGSELLTTLPATITRLAPPKDAKKPDAELPFLIELNRDAEVAFYPVRVKGEDGISNLLLFSVGDFPEIEVKKDDTAQDKSKKPIIRDISPPVVVNSLLEPADRDIYRFKAHAGQTLVFEVEARRMGSAIDPVVRLLDSTGRELAANDDAPGIGVDCRLQYKFLREGEYRVVVHDSRFSDQEQKYYRLKVGEYLFAEGMFPLGWQKGKDTEITLFGGNLPKPLIVHPPLDVSPTQKTVGLSLPVRGPAGSLPMPFVVSDYPEILEPAASGPIDLPPDTVANGRISKPGERDLYRIAARPGEKWFFEVQAAGLETTRLNAYLGIHDGAMKLLASAVDAGSMNMQTEFSFAPLEKGVDPKTVFQVPPGVSELILSVEDINGFGGADYAYRLRATRKYEEFSLEYTVPFINVPAGGSIAIPVRVVRDGYSGPVRLTLVNSGEGLIVEGGHVPPHAKEGLLVVTAKAGISPNIMKNLEVWGEGISSTKEVIRKRAAGLGLVTAVKGARREVGGGSIATQRPYAARWLGLELPAGVSRPAPLALELQSREAVVVQGLKQDLRVKVQRNATINDPIRIESQQPAGVDVNVKGGTVDAKSDTLVAQVTAGPNAKIGRFDMVFVARTEAGGREVTVTSPCITVDLVRAFTLVIPSDAIQIQNGATFVLEGKLHRQYPFQDPVHLALVDLPLHLTSTPVDVPETDSVFRIEIKADPSAGTVEQEVRLVASAKMEGRKDDKDYVIPDTKLRLKITGPSNTASQPQGKE